MDAEDWLTVCILAALTTWALMSSALAVWALL